METNALRRSLAHIVCLPWLLMLLMYLLPLLAIPLGQIFYEPIVITHNMFIHEWYGRTALIFSGCILIAAFTAKPRRPVVLAILICYAIVLLLFAGYTLWWVVTGQQYVW